MRIIKCDFCGKEIKESVYDSIYIGMNMKRYDLCNKCEKKYKKIIKKYKKAIDKIEKEQVFKFNKEIEELTKGEK